MTQQAVITTTARTPVGTANKGSLKDVDGLELGRHVVAAVMERSGIDPLVVDEVALGETLYGGGVIARHAAIEAGLVNAPGVALNRHCASGLAAVQLAASSVIAGMDTVVIAGGAHSSSTMPRSMRRAPGTDDMVPWMSPTHPDSPEAPNLDMSITVGWNAAQVANVTRQEMDAWALRSHQRAVAGIDAGAFVEEIAPITITERDGTTRLFDTDEHPRRDTTAERLAGLKVLHPEIEGFSITAGNASGANDAGAAMLIASSDRAAELDLPTLAIVRGWASVGVNPKDTGIAPTIAIPKALDRLGMKVGDVDLWELNEAFAAMCVATTRILGIDEDIVNVLGSGCSLGHPVGASGARMVISLVHELRRRGGGIGVATMCAGGGMSSAVVLEVPAP